MKYYLDFLNEFKKYIPDDFKSILDRVYFDMGNPKDSFIKILDLKDYGFLDNVAEVVVNFTKSNNKLYYSNVNIYNLLYDNKKIVIPIFIEDNEIDKDRLVSIISHELRHIYDIYTIESDSDMLNFIRSLQISIIKKDIDNKYEQFLYLVYLSLEHELLARYTMLYAQYKNCNCSREKLYKIFEKSYLFKFFELLDDFDSLKFVNNFDINLLLKFTDIFNKHFKGDECNNLEDLKKYYKNWENYFKEKSKEYLEISYKVLDDLSNNIIKEVYYYNKYSSYNEKYFIKIDNIFTNIKRKFKN